MQDEYDCRQVISRLKGCKKTISNMIKLLRKNMYRILRKIDGISE